MAQRVIKSGYFAGKKYFVIDNIDDKYFSKEGKAARILAQPIGMKTNNLITSHPRSGTRWVSTFLVNHGLDMPHEVLGKDGIVSWQHIVPGKHGIKAKNIVHLVRNPLKTIASTAYVLDDHAFPFMFQYIGYPSSREKLDIAMYTWYHWNKLIEERANIRVKFEDILNNPNLIFQAVDFKPSIIRRNLIDKKQNSGVHPDLSWKDLKKRDKALYNKILDMSVEYGY